MTEPLVDLLVDLNLLPSQTQQSLRMLLPASGANSYKIASIQLINRRRLHHRHLHRYRHRHRHRHRHRYRHRLA